MTRMLPSRPHSGATRSERLVFDLIAGDPALDSHIALHSLGLARHTRKSYAECDFVIIGPAGIYCLEVKGGAVSRHEGLWTIGWPGSQYTSEEGPFKQAQAARGGLLGEIRGRLGGDILRRVPVGWGVVFPDVAFNQRDPEGGPECIFDERDRDKPFSVYLERLARYTRQHELDRGRDYPDKVSRVDIETILKTFRPDFDLTPRISSLLRDSRSELLSLSVEQSAHLAAITHPGNRRVICEGSAGTGKTVLAAECAYRLADSGAKVLFLCFNRNLAWHLRRQEFAHNARITIDTNWRFLYDLTRKGGVADQLPRDDYPALAEAAEDAVVTALDRGTFEPFDVLVIDEAQDVLNARVLNVLDWCVRDGIASGRWVLFLDTGVQAGIYKQLDVDIYGRLTEMALNLPLSVNMRNPRAVSREASAFAAIAPPPCRRDLIAPVDYRTVRESRTVNRTVTALLTELIAGGASPADIVLLSFHSPGEAFFAERFDSIGVEIQVLDGQQGAVTENRVLAASIPAFKGLESEIVVIGDLPDGKLNEWQRASLYVGLTRARTAAYVMCPTTFVDYRMELIGRMAHDGDS